VWESLPPRQRAGAVIFTADYGEAGAINELGRGTGLPVAVSGQNSEWWWGPGNPRATTVVAVMPGPVDITSSAATAYLRQFFTHVRVAATLSNPYGIHNQEWDGHVYVCTGLRHPWAQLWPRLRRGLPSAARMGSRSCHQASGTWPARRGPPRSRGHQRERCGGELPPGSLHRPRCLVVAAPGGGTDHRMVG